MKHLKVLIACEESQRVCAAFRELGHEAYSCDIIECSGGHPEWHIKGDVIPLLNGRCSFTTMDGTEHSISGKWDLIIGHPPCTYLSNAGARHIWANHQLQPERVKLGIKGRDLFMRIFWADCDHIAIENPVPNSIFCLPKYNQIIQPYQFGHEASKKTCLWLKRLPMLKPTKIVKPYEARTMTLKDGTVRKSCWTLDCGKAFGGAERAKERSRTFPGIGKAMAEQWSEYLLSEENE